MAPVSRNKLHLLAFLAASLTALPALAIKQATLSEYTAHLESLHTLVQKCQASAPACDPGQVGDDDEVTLQSLGSGANVNQFESRYDWLRKTLKQAQDPKAKNRNSDLAATAERLEDAILDTNSQPPVSDFAEGRRHTDAILAHPEFATVEEQSIWDKLIARFFLWLDRMFGNVAKFGQRSPGVRPLLVWGLIT